MIKTFWCWEAKKSYFWLITIVSNNICITSTCPSISITLLGYRTFSIAGTFYYSQKKSIDMNTFKSTNFLKVSMPKFYSKLTLAIWITKKFWVTSITVWKCNKTSSTSITFISDNMCFAGTLSIFITILTFWAISITFTSYWNIK